MSTPDTKTPADPLEALASSIEQEMGAAPGATANPGDAGQTMEAAPEQPPLSNAEVIAGALYGARDVFCLYTKLQSPTRTLNDQAIGVLAQRWAAVCDKRGVDLSKYFKDYTLELAAVIATVGVARAVHAGVRAELAVLHAETSTAAADAAPASATPKTFAADNDAAIANL